MVRVTGNVEWYITRLEKARAQKLHVHSLRLADARQDL